MARHRLRRCRPAPVCAASRRSWGPSKLALWISGAGLVCMTAAIGWQVFGRFVLNNSPTWTEPVSLLLMLYYILLAAAVGVHERFHFSLDLFRSLASERLRRA